MELVHPRKNQLILESFQETQTSPECEVYYFAVLLLSSSVQPRIFHHKTTFHIFNLMKWMILSLMSHRYMLRNDTICFFSDLVGALYYCNGQRACEDKQKRPLNFWEIQSSSSKGGRECMEKDQWSCREISTTTIKGNTTMSAVITSSVSLTKWQTITFITNGSDELPWLPTEFISSQQWV